MQVLYIYNNYLSLIIYLCTVINTILKIPNILRNRDKYSKKRKDIKVKNSYVVYNKVLSKICEYKSTTSHCLLELSKKQWGRIQDRSINLSGMSVNKVDNGKVQYKNYELGKHLRFQNKKGHSSGKFLKWKSPALANINGGYIAVVGNKVEFLKVNPDLIVVDGSNQELL